MTASVSSFISVGGVLSMHSLMNRTLIKWWNVPPPPPPFPHLRCTSFSPPLFLCCWRGRGGVGNICSGKVSIHLYHLIITWLFSQQMWPVSPPPPSHFLLVLPIHPFPSFCQKRLFMMWKVEFCFSSSCFFQADTFCELPIHLIRV